MHVCSCSLGSFLFRECAFCILPSILKNICMRRQHLSHIPYTLHLKASLRQKLCILHRTASHHYRKLPFAILTKALTTVLTPRPRVSCRYLSKITDFVKDKGKAEPWVTILKPSHYSMGSQYKQMMDFICSGYLMLLRKHVAVSHSPKDLSLYKYYIVFV